MSEVAAQGWFHLVHRGPDGSRIWGTLLQNEATIEGLNGMQEAFFRGASRPSVWYCRLISATDYVGTNQADTHAFHPYWLEFTDVSGGVGVAWAPAAANGGLTTSSTPSTIQITSAGSIHGVFLASRAATGSASGHIIYATAPSASPLPVVAGGTLTIEYSIRLRSGG